MEQTPNVKFIDFKSQAEMEELKKVVVKFFVSLKKEYAPALDLVLSATVEKHINKFLLEEKAIYLLDLEAIDEGYKDAADKHFQLEKKKREEEAKEAARLQAIADAEEAEKQKSLDAQLKIEAEQKAKRDQEDAENAAKKKAILEAQNRGEQVTEL